MNDLKETAESYLKAGLAVLPASKEQKRPVLAGWSEYQTKLPTAEQVGHWFALKHDAMCIVCGKVSGNLEVIDFDNKGELFPKWKEAIPADLLAKLVIEQTQSGGFHVAYRCSEDTICGSIKLAQGVRNGNTITLIETRGEGGLILCAPSENYVLQQGDYTALPELTHEEREKLLWAAYHLDERPHEQKQVAGIQQKSVHVYTPIDSNFEKRPGDDFNERGDIRSILEKHGWSSLGKKPDGNEYWRRPGKTEPGNSATLKDGVFYVFSSNAAPFQPNMAYSKFSVYALLEYLGDFSSAANDLLQQGYGKVKEIESVEAVVLPPEEQSPVVRPWDLVKNEQIGEVLADTILGDLCVYYASATIPPLPLEVAILKAIVSISCALSEKRPESDNTGKGNLFGITAQGAQLARLKIDTAGGQVCNAYAMTVGQSASGKDIGNLLEIAMDHYGWNLGTSGSAEGILEALIKIPNGLQSISELKNWLDPKHYLSKASDSFTEMFSKGYFKVNLSQRNRESNYAYPNVYANIQPDIFAKNVKMTDVTSGFLSRFLMTNMPDRYFRPAKIDLERTLTGIITCLDIFRRKSGVVTVPDLYLDDTAKQFAEYSPKNLGPSWRRLVNEYGPRFAVMLSVTHDPATQGPEVILTEKCWDGAAKLILWFFAHAERLLVNIMDIGETAKERERMYLGIVKCIKRFMPGGARWSDISNYASYGTTKEERADALNEMVDRGWLKSEGIKYLQGKSGHTIAIGERYFLGVLPPFLALAK